MAKQLLAPLQLIARMNFSLKNYSFELFTLIGMVWKVELISTITTAVCESWNVSDKYTWDNATDLKNYPWTKLSERIIGVITRQFFHMITHGFHNSNLSQEIFAIDTWGAVICSSGHGRKHVLTILPTISRPGLEVERSFTFPTVLVKLNNSKL